ncbi:exoglucanase [Plectosphaerella cucumerina]|uniref:Glucanase n=1 Tax=Plectosphaerella cucumerina TaxID=40658 RepID=A0A8K0TDL5_9PEZI|nr:exoglucanase [Plectosphaerella cucumerina]
MKSNYSILLAIMAAAGAKAQQACTLTEETNPSLTWSKCNASGTCSPHTGGLVIDSNWRWTHTVDGYEDCYSGAEWVDSHCPDGATCAKNCCVDGADYQNTYGVSTTSDSVTIRLVTEHEYGTNVGARLYLTSDPQNSKYQMFNLLGNEFTFDVDSSNVACGLNGALYFISMDEDGGQSKFSGNNAGAKYGTGYCDAQCARDLKWIDGEGNVEGWRPVGDFAPNVGIGNKGACCAEMDMWEANKAATSYTPHPCSDNAYHSCDQDTCGGTFSEDRYGGSCDADGCDFNPYRQGNREFYGEGSGFTIDSSSPITVITQFRTGSDGNLSEIRRLYQQNGQTIENSESTAPGNSGNSITAEFCDTQKTAFGESENQFNDFGSVVGMGQALDTGMVLAFSLWTDAHAFMLWLDSTYPTDESGWGAERGPCENVRRTPPEIEADHPNASVTFGRIRFGPIGSTFTEGGSPQPPLPGTTTTATAPAATTTAGTPGGPTAPQWGQCGGQGWSGPTQCVAGTTCTVVNDWYHQCL